MDLLVERVVSCPYCGTRLTAVVDCSGGSQDYVEDCAVCCQPILYRAELDAAGRLTILELRREND